MKKIKVICALLFVSALNAITKESHIPIRIPVDRIAAVVHGPEQVRIICESELKLVSIEGVVPTIDDLIDEELMFQDALKHHATREEDADRYIRTIKENNNITDKDVDRIFEAAGLTPAEGRLKLQKMAAKQTMISIKVASRINIALQDVEKEYAKDPRYEDARYEVEIAFVPFFSHDPIKQEEQYSYLIDQIKHNELDVMWSTPLWVNESDLADNKKFIIGMDVNSVSQPQRVANGFELYRLKAKKDRRLITLQERYRELVDRLRQPKFQEGYDAYIGELRNPKNASIIYIDDAIKDR